MGGVSEAEESREAQGDKDRWTLQLGLGELVKAAGPKAGAHKRLVRVGSSTRMVMATCPMTNSLRSVDLYAMGYG